MSPINRPLLFPDALKAIGTGKAACRFTLCFTQHMQEYFIYTTADSITVRETGHCPGVGEAGEQRSSVGA